ncbi:MAG: primosomal protein N', partial [Novosphingobium sp.]|nr:primosomal protein N' [Novosphingobium sp.]
MNRVRLLVFNPALPVLDYRLPAGMAIEFGQLVIAPLGPRQVLGIVWEPDRLPGDEVPEAKLRPILEVLPVPPLSAPLRRLIEWCADYYVASPNSVARMALGSMAALRGGGTITEYRLSGVEPKRLTPQRAAAMDALHGEQASIRELAHIAGVSEGVLRGMVGAGILDPVTVDLDRRYPRALPDHA